MAVAAGDVAGELSVVGSFGLELGFGAFSAGAFGAGECALGVELGGVAVAEGVAFAGGVVAGALGFVAGVGLGLAGPADLGVGGGAGVAGGGGCFVAFTLAACGFGSGGGDLLANRATLSRPICPSVSRKQRNAATMRPAVPHVP